MNYDFEDSYGKLINLSQGNDKVFIQPDGTKIKKSQIPPEPQVSEITDPSPAFGRPGQSLFGVTTRTADIRPEAAAPAELKEVSYGDILKATSQVVAGMPPGVIAGVAGSPADLAGLIYGGFQAATAEDGSRLEAFMEGFDNPFTQALGSEQFLGIIGDVVDFLPVSEDTKSFVKGGAEAGSFLGLPAAVTAAIGSGVKGLRGARAATNTANVATVVDEVADALEPIVVENPEAGPFDRSQLPEQMQKPEPKPAEIDELGFVQKSLEVAKNLQQQKGTAAQFIKRLKQNGVSDEEIDALGLREKFKSNERITRAQLEQTIRDRRIELQEKVKGSDVEVSEDAYEFDDITFGQGEVDMDSGNWSARADDFLDDAKDGEEFAIATVMDKLAETYPDSYPPEEIARIRQALINKEFDELDSIDRSNIEDAASDVAEAEYLENPYRTYRSNETDNYQIYGNDDIGYQVLRYGNELVNQERVYNLNEAQIIARQDAYELGDLMGAGADTEARFEDFMLPGGENYQEVLIKDPSTPATSYPGDHWNEGNVIGHLLTKDRVDSTGKKALYVEEVQSDFAQSARAKFSRAKRKIDVQMQRTNERIEAIRKTIEELSKRIENPIEGDDVELLKQSLGTKQSGLKSEMRSKELLEQQLQEASDTFDVETEELSKVRFVKDTQQWLRPTLKRLIAKAIEEGYDSVAVPPFQIVHSRYGEDYGDFYRKSVPNTLLKAAKQLDPNAKISRADFSDSLRKGDGADERIIAEAQKAGIEGVQIIEITPAMRKAYEEKGQSLFVPAAGAAIAGKMAVDQMTKDQEDDRAKATR